MWSAQVNGNWSPVGTDEDLTQWAQSGRLRRDTLVHHSALAYPGRAEQVAFLSPIFGPAPVPNELARSARNWGIGAIFCGIAAPIALFMGLSARSEIQREPEKYSNAGDATLAIFLGGGAILMMILGFFGAVMRAGR